MDLIADEHDLVHDLVSLIEEKCRTVPVHTEQQGAAALFMAERCPAI